MLYEDLSKEGIRKDGEKNVFSNPEVAGFQRFNFFIAPHCP